MNFQGQKLDDSDLKVSFTRLPVGGALKAVRRAIVDIDDNVYQHYKWLYEIGIIKCEVYGIDV